MRDQSGLRYLFHQPNLNPKQPIFFAILIELDFEIRYIKGKENKDTYALSKKVQVNHIETKRSYGTELHERIL